MTETEKDLKRTIEEIRAEQETSDISTDSTVNNGATQRQQEQSHEDR